MSQNWNLQEEEWKLNSIYLTMQKKKTNFESGTGVDTPKFAWKVDFANLKFNVDNLDIDKFKNVPTNLSSLKSIR